MFHLFRRSVKRLQTRICDCEWDEGVSDGRNLTCPKCGHVRILDEVSLWWLFHQRRWDGTLALVGRRLCCSSCQVREYVQRPQLMVGRDPPTGAPLPYPDAVTRKRLVSRYRS